MRLQAALSAATLSAATVLAIAAPAAAQDNGTSPEELQHIRNALGQRVQFEFQDTPIADVMRALRDVCEINVVVDPRVVPAATLVTFQASELDDRGRARGIIVRDFLIGVVRHVNQRQREELALDAAALQDMERRLEQLRGGSRDDRRRAVEMAQQVEQAREALEAKRASRLGLSQGVWQGVIYISNSGQSLSQDGLEHTQAAERIAADQRGHEPSSPVEEEAHRRERLQAVHHVRAAEQCLPLTHSALVSARQAVGLPELTLGEAFTRRLSTNFDDAPFLEAVTRLRARTGLDIEISSRHRALLNRQGVRVNLRLWSVQVQNLLAHFCRSTGMEFTIRDGQVTLTPGRALIPNTSADASQLGDVTDLHGGVESLDQMIPQEDIDELVGMLGRASTRDQASRRLALVGAPSAPSVARLVGDANSDSPTRIAALELLARLGTAEQESLVLGAFLDDPALARNQRSIDERAQAGRTLGAIGARHGATETTIGKLIDVLAYNRETNPWFKICETSRRALIEIGSPAVQPLLQRYRQELARRTNSTLVFRTLLILGEIHDEDCIQTLLQALIYRGNGAFGVAVRHHAAIGLGSTGQPGWEPQNEGGLAALAWCPPSWKPDIDGDGTPDLTDPRDDRDSDRDGIPNHADSDFTASPDDDYGIRWPDETASYQPRLVDCMIRALYDETDFYVSKYIARSLNWLTSAELDSQEADLWKYWWEQHKNEVLGLTGGERLYDPLEVELGEGDDALDNDMLERIRAELDAERAARDANDDDDE
jgi:hypothetical protein